jgi:hypothetical protein
MKKYSTESGVCNAAKMNSIPVAASRGIYTPTWAIKYCVSTSNGERIPGGSVFWCACPYNCRTAAQKKQAIKFRLDLLTLLLKKEKQRLLSNPHSPMNPSQNRKKKYKI